MDTPTLQSIRLSIGMHRAEVEKLVAEVLKTESTYNVYEGSIQGDQTAQYTDGTTVLEVEYNHGTPAPWVIDSEGVGEHYPPGDQTVRSFHFN